MKVSLFVTCLVDQFFPHVGESAVKVLRRLGAKVEFPSDQTCCGQLAFNDGFRGEAKRLAERFISIFEESEYIVAPSGSCVCMVRVFYPELFEDDPRLLQKARMISSRVYEFSEFLVKVCRVEDTGAFFNGMVTYHESCHALRELKISEEPRRLIRAVRGCRLVEMERADSCCGFGGIFSVKLPHVSTAILDEKLKYIVESGAESVVATDMGCLMHLAGGLSRRKIPVKAIHIAELLANF